MIVMINGAFGIGKTSVAEKLLLKMENSMIYDPEEVGVMLKNIIPNNMKTTNECSDDFQDLELWRKLVVSVAEELISKYKKNLIVPMTLKNKEYFNYINSGFKNLDEQVVHYCLVASLGEVQNRLISRGGNKGSWAFEKASECVEIFNSMFVKDHLDTSNKTLDEVANEVYKKISKLNDKHFLSEFLGERFYNIKAKELDLTAINSAHQRIRQIIKRKPYCEVVVENNPLIIQQQLDIIDLNKYLKQSKNIECNSSEIRDIIKNIVNGENRQNEIIKKVLNFTRNIESIENILIKGNKVQSANNKINKFVIEASECSIDSNYKTTSVFIALMRTVGIPCKFILGKSEEKANHSWAEVYIKEQGWIPVETEENRNNDDVENWYFGVTNKHVKILEDVDYENIDIMLRNMNLEIKLIN